LRLLMFLEDYRFGIHVEASGKSNSKPKTATVSIEMNDAHWSVLMEIYSTVRNACMIHASSLVRTWTSALCTDVKNSLATKHG
jgi:hypothetical protein